MGLLRFAHIRRLGPFSGFQNCEFQFFGWVTEKQIVMYRGGVMNILGYITKLDYFGGSFLYV